VTHLVGGHLADGVSGLQGLQLVQAPVQLLQGFGGQFLVGLLWRETGKGVISFEAFDRASRGFPNIVHIVDSHAGMSAWVTLHAALKRSGITDQTRDAPCPLLTPDPLETIKQSHSAVSPAVKGSWCKAHQSPMLLENKTRTENLSSRRNDFTSARPSPPQVRELQMSFSLTQQKRENAKDPPSAPPTGFQSPPPVRDPDSYTRRRPFLESES